LTSGQARDAINGSAIVVAGIYFYRKLVEPDPNAALVGRTPHRQPNTIPAAAVQLIGVGPLASTGRFVVGFGFTYMVLSLMEGASPDLAGSFALLVALGAVLGNGVAVTKDVKDQLNERERALAKASGITSHAPTVRVASWEPVREAPPSAPRKPRKPNAKIV
jgi:hypothetical protein